MADSLEMNETRRLIASDKVEGTKVYNPQNEKLGTITNVMIDKVSGKSEYAVMEFGGVFGLGREHYPIPWEMLTYDTENDGYVVDIAKDQLTDAPHYRIGEVPEYSDSYNRNVYGHYGLNYPLL